MVLKRILLLILLCGALSGKAQSILDFRLNGSEQGKPLSTVLAGIEESTHGRFFFLDSWLKPIAFTQSYAGKTLAEALDDLFLGTDLTYFTMAPHEVVIIRDPTQSLLRRQAITIAIREHKKIKTIAFGQPGNAVKGQPVIITGRVIDAKTRQPMPRTNIRVNDMAEIVTTDENGKYALTIKPGAHVVTFSFVEYDDRVIDLLAFINGEINQEMEETPVMLDEVVIQDRAARENTTNRIGQTQLAMKELKRAPALLGEADVVKQIQTLPGVTTVGEAASGFNVRGGSVDQNLVLYDGIPVFNSTHIFGFLSSFNPEAVREVSFYKGGIPAEYGGRASSVMDIKSKDGDRLKWNGNAGIGMITSNFSINGPIVKEKTSIAASFRSTYSNWLIHSIKTDYVDLSKSNVSFYDATLKLTHLFSDRTKLSVTGYTSHDALRLLGDSTYQWNNRQLSARLDHQFSPALSAEFIAGVGGYNYHVINNDPLTSSSLSFALTAIVAKAQFHYIQEKHKISFGAQFMPYLFDPGSFKPESSLSGAASLKLNRQYSIENAIHISDDYQLNDKMSIEAGLRLPLFVVMGPGSVYRYQPGLPRQLGTITDTLNYSSAQPIKTYFGVEPRISFRQLLSGTSSLKMGYHRMYQFLHLISNTAAVTPVDIWQPSGYYFKPQHADQFSVGYFKDFSEKKYSTSVEIFYKALKNVLDFRDGAQLVMNNHLETDLLQGKGQSYGVETSVVKNIGRLTGSLNYTFSRSFRTIAGINDGKQYRSNFDQPHVVNLSWKYSLSRRYYFTGSFTYHTGRPVTIPIYTYINDNLTVAYYSDRNQYRIPDYHRLDVGLVLEGNHKRKKLGSGVWVISLYNVYGRKNPYSVFFKNNKGGVPQSYQLSIIGTILPSISYNVKF